MRLGRLSPRDIIRSGGLLRQIFEQTAANLTVQLLGAVTTLSFIRLLPQQEYATFGLCLATVGFIAMASDMGLMASMNFFWRKDGAGGPGFAERYAAVRRVRLYLFALFGTGASAFLAYLEFRQGTSTGTIVLTVGFALLLSWSQILAAMTVQALRLAQQLRRAYSVDLAGAVLRAALALIAFALALRQAWFPLASLGAASLLTLYLSRRHVPAQFTSKTRPTPDAMRSVMRYVLPTMPATLLFSTQDIFVYWLASFGGGAIVVAQTFALGRLAAIFVTLNSIIANVIIPRMVNMADDRQAHRMTLIPIVIVAAICGGLTGLSALFPDLFLLALGRSYDDLGAALVLSLGAASLQLVAQALGQLNRTMGWVRWETPMIGLHAVLVIALVPFFSFSTAEGVLTFNLVLAVLGLCEMIAIGMIGYLGLMRSVPPASEHFP